MVYFVKAEATGLIKIGQAKDPVRRLKALQQSSPDRLTLLGVAPDLERFSEDALHKRWAAQRKHGEWFSPDPGLLEFIRVYAGKPLPTAPPELFAIGSILTPGSFGNVILAYRKQAGWDQHDLADAAHVSRKFVIDAEHGKPTAQIGKLLALANALKIPLTVRPA